MILKVDFIFQSIPKKFVRRLFSLYYFYKMREIKLVLSSQLHFLLEEVAKITGGEYRESKQLSLTLSIFLDSNIIPLCASSN